MLPPLESIMCWLRASLAAFIDSLIVIDENPGNFWIFGSRLGKADDFLEAFPKSCRKLTILGMVLRLPAIVDLRRVLSNRGVSDHACLPVKSFTGRVLV